MFACYTNGTVSRQPSNYQNIVHAVRLTVKIVGETTQHLSSVGPPMVSVGVHVCGCTLTCVCLCV